MTIENILDDTKLCIPELASTRGIDNSVIRAVRAGIGGPLPTEVGLVSSLFQTSSATMCHNLHIHEPVFRSLRQCCSGRREDGGVGYSFRRW
jgi:hypothetical protein